MIMNLVKMLVFSANSFVRVGSADRMTRVSVRKRSNYHSQVAKAAGSPADIQNQPDDSTANCNIDSRVRDQQTAARQIRQLPRNPYYPVVQVPSVANLARNSLSIYLLSSFS